MSKSFIDVVQDSPRTRLGIPVKTKNPRFRTNTRSLRLLITKSKSERNFPVRKYNNKKKGNVERN